ncbi:undecaprenyl-diphosphatase [Ramlibacter sp. MMS24-I3-19]|uniref:undecaprenyl-diphosphatase n=1 Tax=Ramlibacter sp. MMS24-I3-19 TaxID=3416606 RepID=UPI003D010CD5
MDELLLFDRLNATHATPHWEIAAAMVIAQWVIWAIPVALVWAWLRGREEQRRALLEMLLAALLALGVAQIVTHVWPHPRPFMAHAGTQFLAHVADPGMPSDHVTVFWSLACAAAISARFARWSLPLFALGLLVGWSRVFLGVHFPYDIAAALPVAFLGAALARSARSPMARAYTTALDAWSHLEHLVRGRPASTSSSHDGDE